MCTVYDVRARWKSEPQCINLNMNFFVLLVKSNISTDFQTIWSILQVMISIRTASQYPLKKKKKTWIEVVIMQLNHLSIFFSSPYITIDYLYFKFFPNRHLWGKKHDLTLNLFPNTGWTVFKKINILLFLSYLPFNSFPDTGRKQTNKQNSILN